MQNSNHPLVIGYRRFSGYTFGGDNIHFKIEHKGDTYQGTLVPTSGIYHAIVAFPLSASSIGVEIHLSDDHSLTREWKNSTAEGALALAIDEVHKLPINLDVLTLQDQGWIPSIKCCVQK